MVIFSWVSFSTSVLQLPWDPRAWSWGGKDTQGRSGQSLDWRLLLSSGETKSQQGIQIISSGPYYLVTDEHVGKVVFLVNGNKN